MSLTIQVRQTTVVRLKGRLDTVTAPMAETSLAPVLASAPRYVVFDLADLEFISSAGLRVLLGVRKTLTDAGSECLLVNMKPQIEKVIEVVKALPGLRIFKDAKELDSYLAALQERILQGDV
jgi:anti-sigma B factor antagonist